MMDREVTGLIKNTENPNIQLYFATWGTIPKTFRWFVGLECKPGFGFFFSFAEHRRIRIGNIKASHEKE